jgi:signal peptidase I
MRSLPVKIVGAVVSGAIVIGLWAFFAPTKVGGSTTYSVTSGISMEPLLHKNDLAFVRSQASYHVGDIVLYNSQVLHKPVLHRIILIQHGNYFFKGDNNGFVDPGYATRSELVGTMWFSVPGVGAVLGWLGKPFHAALLAGLAVMLIVVTGFTTTKSRRRRRRGSHPMNPQPAPPERAAISTEESSSEPRESRAGAGSRRPPPYFDGPAPTLIALGVVFALAVMLLGAGFTRSAHRVGVQAGAYQQSGTFSYSATANAPTAVYPNGTVTTGDPIYPSLVDTVTLKFAYQLTSALPHRIKGTVVLRALVLSQSDTWQEVSTVVPITRFSSDKTSISTDLPLASLYRLIDSVSTQSGVVGASYSVDIQPVVHITGTVGNRRINDKFSPVLPFTVTKAAIRVDVAVAPPPPGATYVPGSSATALAAALHPVQVGSVPKVVANDIAVAKYKFAVPAVRVLGIAFALLMVLLAIVHDRLRRRGTKRSNEEVIARRLHALIVPVAALDTADGRAPIVVPDFAQLAGLARFLERPILYEVQNGNRTYAVDDESIRYFTCAADRRAARAGTDEPSPDTRAHRKQVASSEPKRHVSKRAFAARAAAGLVVLAVLTTLTLSFTASTNVPASRVGASVQPGQVMQAAPANCSSLALTTLVRGTGTFSNSASHALVLGSAGVDRITSTGQYNCIVGGGGKDTVNAKSTDVCIIGPTAGTTYNVCSKKP